MSRAKIATNLTLNTAISSPSKRAGTQSQRKIDSTRWGVKRNEGRKNSNLFVTDAGNIAPPPAYADAAIAEEHSGVRLIGPEVITPDQFRDLQAGGLRFRSSEQRLWYAVWRQAIEDLQKPAFSIREQRIQREARSWIEGERFTEVCDYLNLDADYMRERLLDDMEEPIVTEQPKQKRQRRKRRSHETLFRFKASNPVILPLFSQLKRLEQGVPERKPRRRAPITPDPRPEVRRHTHCPHEHEYTPENSSYTKDGQRMCRTCHRAHNLTYMRERRGALRHVDALAAHLAQVFIPAPEMAEGAA